jgi:DNA-binding NarL/FixJ family response regulator
MTLDLIMPDMDGFDALRTVRSKHPELKIIVVSGFRQGSMNKAAKSLGAAATLDKNLATPLLLPMVCDLLTHLDGPCGGKNLTFTASATA